MKQSTLIVGLLIVIGVGGVWYYTNAMSANETQTTPTPAISGPESTQQVKEIKVEAGSFYYKPNTMTVKKGEKVRIVMNAVSMMHDFNIAELNVKMPIVKNGDTGTVEFIPDKVGTFEYYCSVGQHRANGQVGKITVE